MRPGVQRTYFNSIFGEFNLQQFALRFPAALRKRFQNGVS